jgi:hypothetical protein
METEMETEMETGEGVEAGAGVYGEFLMRSMASASASAWWPYFQVLLLLLHELRARQEGHPWYILLGDVAAGDVEAGESV